MDALSPAAKTNRVLHLVLVSFFLIAFRVWHLGVIQREEKLLEAQKPKLRTLFLHADRGIIYDRFHIPLATNRICYTAAVYYGQLAQIPISSWNTGEGGKRVRTYPRKEHIAEMSKVLGRILSLDPGRIEDLIHAKAALLPHVPYVLKTDLSEEEYYQIKMLEREWLGLSAEIGSERYYPLGKTGCHLIGSLGSISPREYGKIVGEIATLQRVIDSFENHDVEETLPPGYDSLDGVYARLYELKEKAYTLNDRVGKSGVEGKFEEALRGFWGLKKFEVDQKGRALRELPGGKEPIPGAEISLSISSELQQFAEELLIQNEKDRQGRSLGVDQADNVRKIQKQPWIKGGSIIALDPLTGEILAFASHPRFNPNDFIGLGKQGVVSRWLEGDKFVAELWNGHQLLAREWPMGRKIGEEKKAIEWDFFLDQILPVDGPLRQLFHQADDLKSAIHIQEDFESLLYFAKGKSPRALMNALSPRLESFLGAIPSAADRLFAIDLFRLAVCSPRFSDELLAKVSSMKLSTYHSLFQAFARFEKKIKDETFTAFHSTEFPAWRSLNQKDFLLEKRREEKERKTYARPYIDYLDKKERELFGVFWEENKIPILKEKLRTSLPDPDRETLQRVVGALSDELGEEFLRTFRSFQELDRPLFSSPDRTEKDLASSLYPKEGFGFSRSYAYQTSAPQGSIFKLISAYEGLRQGLHFSLIDEFNQDPQKPPGKNQIVAYSLDHTPYPRLYKGGRLPRTSASRVGEIDLIGAIEHSSNPYFAILAGDYLKNPDDLNTAARLFGLGEKSGIELPGEAAGNLPTDLKTNRTGLYSYAIGQHTLLTTPLQSALMLATLANGGQLLKPKIVKRGEDPSEPIIRRSFPLPPRVRYPIFEGMDRSLWSGQGNARPSAMKALLSDPTLMGAFLSLEHQMIGKSSTAEIFLNLNTNPSSLPQMYKHIWFGSIFFDQASLISPKEKWEHPELVVVVFLRYGDAGREAAPLAAQMIHKWREIKKKHTD